MAPFNQWHEDFLILWSFLSTPSTLALRVQNWAWIYDFVASLPPSYKVNLGAKSMMSTTVPLPRPMLDTPQVFSNRKERNEAS